MPTPTIDLSAPGKNIGFAGFVHSDNRFAHSVIPVPIAVVNGGPGPTVLVTAGVHGDEYAGIAAARQLIDELEAEQITGRVIIMPMLNLPAWRANTRVSPLDDGNLNRAFPGKINGTPTEQIADFVENSILPDVDYALDLHTGGTTSRYLPSTFIYAIKDSAMDEKLSAARAFAAPHCFVVKADKTKGSLSAACERKDVVCVATEISGGSTLEPAAIKTAKVGAYRLLKHWGVIDDLPAAMTDPNTTTFVDVTFDLSRTVIVPADGLIVPMCDLGGRVQQGDTLARLYPMDDLGRAPIDLKAPISGLIVTMTARTMVVPGDFFAVLGHPMTMEEAKSCGS